MLIEQNHRSLWLLPDGMSLQVAVFIFGLTFFGWILFCTFPSSDDEGFFLVQPYAFEDLRDQKFRLTKSHIVIEKPSIGKPTKTAHWPTVLSKFVRFLAFKCDSGCLNGADYDDLKVSFRA